MSYTTIHVRALLDAVARAGIDVKGRVALAGLSTLDLHTDLDGSLDVTSAAPDLEARGSAHEHGIAPAAFERLLEQCLAASSNPALGLAMGEHASLVSLGVSEVPSASRVSNLSVVIETFNAGFAVSVDDRAPRLTVSADEAVLSFPMHGQSEAVQRLRAEYGVTLALLLLRAWAGPFATPCWISFPYQAPDYVSEYHRLLGGRIRFGAEQVALAFNTELLSAPIYPWGRQLVRPSAVRHAVAGTCAGERVRRFLASHGAPNRPDMAEIAAHLGMTERTLRRRLASEGIRFRELWDDAQRDRALLLALDLEHSPETVSEALGFSEVSAFYRAFKRWSGFTPSQYRAMHLRDNLASTARGANDGQERPSGIIRDGVSVGWSEQAERKYA
jgi:AraC-like DNA-binding protein